MVDEIIKQIHQGKMIDDMTKKYQYSRIPIFYKLTKIHKPIPVGRPIISGRDGPTERIYFLRNTTPAYRAIAATILYNGYHCFYQFLRKTKIGKDTILVLMVVPNFPIPQEEGTKIICETYESSTTITHRSQRITSGKCLT